MGWLNEHLILLAFLIPYLAVMFYHAWRGQQATHQIADYYVGGRTLGGIAIGMSFFATYGSTNIFIGISAEAYSAGPAFLLMAPFAVFFAAIAWIWMAPRLREATALMGSMTIPDFIGFRFQTVPGRVLAAIVLLFASVLYLTAVFKGAGLLLQAALDISYFAAVAVVFVVVSLYTAAGGFHSVIKTDMVQGGIMLVGAAILLSFTIKLAGGPGVAVDLLADKEFPGDQGIPFAVLLGVMIAGTMKLIVEPRQISRFYGLKDHDAVRSGRWVGILGMCLLFGLLMPIGLYARAIFPDGTMDSDLIVPTLVSSAEYIPPIFGAFLTAAMIAAAMSSIDSVLLVMASTFERDLAGLIRPPQSDKSALNMTRIYVVLFAAIIAFVALDPPGSIVAITALSGSLYAACFFAPLMFGLFWRLGNGQAATASIISGAVMLFGWPYLDISVHALFPSLFVSTLIYIAISLKEPATLNLALTRMFSGTTEVEDAPKAAGETTE